MQFNPRDSLKDSLAPTIISMLCIAIALLGSPLTDVLRYDSQALHNHEYWRLFTPHFVHLSWSHLAMNMGGLFLIFLFFARCLTWQYWATSFVVSSVGISLLIFWLNPEIRWYVGMSGVLHTLFLMGGLADILIRKWEGILFSAMIVAKVAYEQSFGPLPGSAEAAGGPVLVDAHFYGALIGGLVGLLYLYKNK